MASIQFTSAGALSSDKTFDPSVLAGKSIIVTGGTSGIGEAAVRAFLAHGAFVTVGARKEQAGEALLSEFGNKQLRFVRCDIKSWADQLKLFKTAIAESPAQTIDIVFANAGVSGPDEVYLDTPVGPDGDPVEPKVHVVETNIVGTMYTIKLANHYLPRQPSGDGRDRLVLITGSMAGYADQPGAPQYAAAKFGVRGVMRCMRRTSPKHGVRYNLLAPWYIPSKVMAPDIIEKIKSNGVDLGDMADAVTAILHIASDTSLNGRSIAVVPRSEHPKGYLDLKQDDIDEDPFLGPWQTKCTQAATHL